MARPTKQGLDYFPIDCVFDDDLQLFITENGVDSLSVLIVTWQIIYQNDGYFVVYDKKLPLKIKQRILIDVERINYIINKAVLWGIFDESLFKKYKILTSSGVQKRYFIGSRLKKEVDIFSEYLIKNVSNNSNIIYNTVSNVGNAAHTGINDVENATNVKEEVNVKEKEDTFLFFYEKYGVKKQKGKTVIKWNNMSLTDQRLAYSGIDKYKSTIPEGVNMCYPLTYLNQRRWEDEIDNKDSQGVVSYD